MRNSSQSFQYFPKEEEKNDQGIYGSLFISMSTINEMKV